MVTIHIDASSVLVRVTCEFHSYEQFLVRCFYPGRKVFLSNLYNLNSAKTCINLIYTRHDTYLFYVMNYVTVNCSW